MTSPITDERLKEILAQAMAPVAGPYPLADRPTVVAMASELVAAREALRLSGEFARQFIQAATEDHSIQNSRAFKSDDISWLVEKARALSGNRSGK